MTWSENRSHWIYLGYEAKLWLYLPLVVHSQDMADFGDPAAPVAEMMQLVQGTFIDLKTLNTFYSEWGFHSFFLEEKKQ